MNLTFLVQIALFIIMIGLAFIDTSEWPVVFFWITMIIAILFNTVNGIFQSCIYGFVAKFPMKYINYVTFGFSFSGTIASIFLIVSLMLSPHPRTVALYYFSFATGFMILCYINEIFLLKNVSFTKYQILFLQPIMLIKSLAFLQTLFLWKRFKNFDEKFPNHKQFAIGSKCSTE